MSEAQGTQKIHVNEFEILGNNSSPGRKSPLMVDFSCRRRKDEMQDNQILTKERLLSASELASVLNVPISWIYSRTQTGVTNSIPSIKVGHYRRFDLSQVMAWLRTTKGVAGKPELLIDLD